MRRTLTGTAAAAALATVFVIPPAFAQETQQNRQAPAGMESGQHRDTGQGQMGERAGQPRTGQPGAQAQTEQPRMGAEPSQRREREQAGKPGMRGESAQTQAPTNRMQPENRTRGSQAEEREAQPQGQGAMGAQERKGQAENRNRAEERGRAAEQNRAGQAQTGQAQNRQTAPQTGQAGRQTTGQTVHATGRANIPQDKAVQVAQTLRSGTVQRSTNIDINEVNVGASLPGDVIIDPLPPTIVGLVPEFRGYDYFVVGDEVVIVDPATRQVVEILQDVG